MRYFAAGLLLLLAGCAGTPTTYLALAPVPGSTIPVAGGTALAVAHVAMPAAIDRLYLTSATGATTLHVASHARWVAPLGGQAQTTLARDLLLRLPGADVIMPGDVPPPGGARTVHVNVIRFLPEPGAVVLDADWRITAAGHHATIARGRFHVEIPAGSMPASRAEAMSVALGRLADAIAARVG